MRLEEQARHRNEIAGIRAVLKADYDRRLQQHIDMEERKSKERGHLEQLKEHAQYEARQELVRFVIFY